MEKKVKRVKKKKNKKLQLFVEFLICCIIIVSVFGLRSTYGKWFLKEQDKTSENQQSNNQENNQNNDQNNNQKQDQEAKKVLLTPSEKTEAINSIINEYKTDNNKISVIYKDLKEDYRYSFNEEEYFPAASTTKVIYALFIYDKIKKGQLAEDAMIDYKEKYLTEGGGEITNGPKKDKYPLEDVIMNMLTHSDNTATAMIVGNNTNAAHVLKYYFDKLKVEYNQKMIENNKVTASMMEKIWQYLYKNQNDYPKIIEYLKNSESNEWIKQGILNKTIASKYGAIDNIANNTAIVYDEKGDYLLIIYTEALSNSGEAISEIADKINKLHDDNRKA